MCSWHPPTWKFKRVSQHGIGKTKEKAMSKPEEQFLDELQNLFLNRLDKTIRPLSQVLDQEKYYKLLMQEIEHSEEVREAIKKLIEAYKVVVKKRAA